MSDISCFNSRTKPTLVLIFFFIFLASCKPLGELEETTDDFCLGATLSDGTCIRAEQTPQTITVDQTDDDNTATGFGGGTHTGTVYQSGVLTLNTTTNNAELDESWTPKWDNVVSYLPMENSWVDKKGIVVNELGSPIFSSDAKIANYSGLFDGVDDYLSGTLNQSIQRNSYSISLWFKTTSTGDEKFISFSHNVLPAQIRLGKLRVCYVTICVAGSRLVNDGKWHHIIAVGDGISHRVYLDGSTTPEITLNGSLTGSLGSVFIVGSARFVLGYYFDGLLDDIAIWNVPLTSEERSLIYSRQSARYSGEMKSRIIDSKSTNSSWTNIDWLTPLPFGKELPDGGGAANSESSADYSDLYSDSLMEGLVGLWHFNESSTTIGTNNDFVDESGNGNHGEQSVGPIFGAKGIFQNSLHFDGINDYATFPNLTTFDSRNSFSVCFWFNDQERAAGWDKLLSIYPKVFFSLGDNNDQMYMGRGYPGQPSGATIVVNNVLIGKWEHYCLNYDGNTLFGYRNGSLISSSTDTFTAPTTSNPLILGRASSGFWEYTKAMLDELTIWNRVLDPDEVLQLYRRGANRIKYQVRSCTASDCSDQDAATGDGWQGPGGNYLTYFSELYNNSSISTSNCTVPQACFGSELILDGDVQTESPSIRFDDFGADGIYMNNRRYFQYRVIMESDDENTACAGGTTCMPELKSVEIGPAHTYQE